MEYFFIIIIIGLVLPLTVYWLLNLRHEKRNQKVLQHSARIRALEKLNKGIGFHFVKNQYNMFRHFDNKSHFNRVQPADLMATVVRANIDSYTEFLGQIRENRELYAVYQPKVGAILSSVTQAECSELHMSVKEYQRREQKLFEQKILHPPVDCLLMVDMTYTSAKGQVHLSKHASFDYDDVFSCLESVSRTYLDKNTYARLAKVERSLLTDSMRYDVLRRDNFRCVICGASAENGARLHVDHILPIAKGGKTTPDNLRVLCERCNIGKSDKIESQVDENNERICRLCGAKMVLRAGKYGKFYGCENYPRCKFTIKIQ